MTSETPTEEGIEAGRRLFAAPCTFVLGAARIEQLPPPGRPEVAFAGRSNVGKSSLINALTQRQQLARTSNTPGRTQQINFFDLGGRLTLVDLPGYGFARAPKSAVESWTRLMRAFLRGRNVLRLTCVLVDSRHGLKDLDRTLLDLLGEAAVAFRIVLTKADQVRSAALADLSADIAQELAKRPAAHPEVLATSSTSKQGIDRLRARLAELGETGTP